MVVIRDSITPSQPRSTSGHFAEVVGLRLKLEVTRSRRPDLMRLLQGSPINSTAGSAVPVACTGERTSRG